jgi:hypothetical protein|nr:MAG TPA: minor structural protein [Caudoviricetes sp.]
MNKEKLIEMGLTEELATSVMKELDGNYVPKARFNEVNTELKQAKDQVKERDSQLETLKKNVGDSEELKKQIEALQNDNKTKDEAHAAEIKQIKIDAAVDKALADAKAKNPKAVKALLDLAKAEISDDGTIKGLDAQIKTLSEAEDSKFLFDTDNTQNKNQNSKGFVPGQKKDGVPGASSEYETRLAEARKNGNTLEAIKIKQEAAADGVVLL